MYILTPEATIVGQDPCGLDLLGYHLAASYHVAEFEYHSAVGKIARHYLNMDEAYKSLRNKSSRSDYESTFIDKYERIHKSMA